MEKQEISFGAHPSAVDDLRINASMLTYPVAEAPLAYSAELTLGSATKKLCNQRKLGICTNCCVRKMCEHHFNDGIELSEYWGYLMGKVTIDGNLEEGSSILTMLKSAHKDHNGIPEKSIENKYPLKVDGTYEDFINNFIVRYGGNIPAEVLLNAKKHMIPGYYEVDVTPMAIAKEIQANRMLGYRFAVGDNTYTDKDGNYTRSAKDLLPLRNYRKFDSGHAWVGHKHTGLFSDGKFAGMNSWSETWCPDNKEDGAGMFNFIFNTQAPIFFTEAWAIMDEQTKFVFTVDLDIGSEGLNVVALQKLLVKLNFLTMPVGVAYGYFGPLTQAAVKKYQIAHGIKPTLGYFGPLTRKSVNSL